MYYLVSERPNLDYLMLISDGVMGGLIMALILLWLMNKERSKDLFSILIILYTLLLFIKVFVGTQLGIQEGLYGFKFNGLYVFFFFAGSYILRSYKETRSVLGFSTWMLFLTALYGIKQILFGFTGFEQKWLDSITFTTLRIDGVVRPFSTYVSPAAMSDGMTILFLLGIFWMYVRGRHLKPFGLIMTASSIAPIMIATVRTNWLAVAVGVLFYCVFLRIRNTRLQWGLIVVMMLGIGFYSAKGGGSGGGGGSSQDMAFASRMNRKAPNLTETMIMNRTSALTNPLQEYSVQKRLETWAGIIITSFYIPFGKGQGTTGYAHSYYFLVLGEIGYPGFLCFLAIVWVGFYRGMKVIANSRNKDEAELMKFMITLVFVLSVLNLTGTHLHTPPGDIFFWFTMGAISRFYKRWREEEALEARAAAALEPQSAQMPNPQRPAGLPGSGLPGRAFPLPGGSRA
jgi:hypothetical protein